MRFVIFTHSLVSDWNHGNAHFLRGVATELVERGHDRAHLRAADGWSRQNLLAEHGDAPSTSFRRAYPASTAALYDAAALDLARALAAPTS